MLQGLRDLATHLKTKRDKLAKGLGHGLKSQQFVDSNGGLGNKCSLGLKERMGAKGPELLVGHCPQFNSLDIQINLCVKEDDCLSE